MLPKLDNWQFVLISRKIKARGGSRSKKCSILVFKYVIELEKNEQDAKNGRLI